MPIAAFFDWDGTLSADGQTVASDTVDAIHALQQGGNAAIPVSYTHLTLPTN